MRANDSAVLTGISRDQVILDFVKILRPFGGQDHACEYHPKRRELTCLGAVVPKTAQLAVETKGFCRAVDEAEAFEVLGRWGYANAKKRGVVDD